MSEDLISLSCCVGRSGSCSLLDRCGGGTRIKDSSRDTANCCCSSSCFNPCLSLQLQVST